MELHLWARRAAAMENLGSVFTAGVFGRKVLRVALPESRLSFRPSVAWLGHSEHKELDALSAVWRCSAAEEKNCRDSQHSPSLGFLHTLGSGGCLDIIPPQPSPERFGQGPVLVHAACSAP